MSADNTSKMIQLLGSLRKEMNGAVADSMYYYGDNYGLNYGVSIPTIRSKAAKAGRDHEFAKYLYKQQVRELRLAALHIAEPELMLYSEAEFWAEGVINSEVAEEMAFALLCNSKEIELFFDLWTKSDNKFLAYAAIMAAARSKAIAPVKAIEQVASVIESMPEERFISQSAVALMAATFDRNHDLATKELICNTINSLSESTAKEYIREEMEWRMEF